MGVIEAMKALGSGVPMGGSHGIGHQLGPLGVGHGETSCVMLPAILKYNYKHGDEKARKPQQKVLDILWDEETVADVLKRRGLKRETADAGDVVGAIISELGMPRTLQNVGVGREKLDALADNCLKDRCLVSIKFVRFVAFVILSHQRGSLSHDYPSYSLTNAAC